MNMIFLGCLAVSVVSVSLALWMHQHSKKQQESKQKTGVIWLKCLRDFLENIQKHRGLSTAYINGAVENKATIETLQLAVNENIESVKNTGPWIQNSERWTLIIEHWQRLERTALSNRDPDNNLLQHNKMIQNALYLVEEMADEHALFELQESMQHSIEFLWRDLLHVIEYLGQARAIGSGITSKRKCSSVERIRMNYLYIKIQESCASMLPHLANGAEVEREVSSMLVTIQENLLGAKCSIDTPKYFSMATKTIEFLYAQYDCTLQKSKVA